MSEMEDGVLTINVEPGFRDLEVTAFRGKISIEMNDHWCGDTETGFGAMISMELSPEQAMELAQFLLSKANPHSEKVE